MLISVAFVSYWWLIKQYLLWLYKETVKSWKIWGRISEYQRAETRGCNIAAEEGAILQIPAECSVFSQINSCQYEGAVPVSSYLGLPDSLNHFPNTAALIVAILLGINGDLDLEHLSSQISNCLFSDVAVAGTASDSPAILAIPISPAWEIMPSSYSIPMQCCAELSH